MAKVPVPADATAKSYYMYYDYDMEPVSLARIAAISQSKGSIEDAVEIDEINRVLTEKSADKNFFYPLLDNGLYVAVDIDMPNVTADMLNWWFVWHTLEPLRYIIWNPEEHLDVRLEDQDRKKIENPGVPMSEKLWGVNEVVRQAIGGHAGDMKIRVGSPAEMGLDSSLLDTPNCRFALCANTTLEPAGNMPMVMLLTASEAANGGLVFHVRTWMGYCIENSVGKYVMDDEYEVPEHIAIALIVHYTRDMEHLSKILPELYAQEKGLL